MRRLRPQPPRVPIRAIREGAGYQDLANDLEALADIYQRPAVRLVLPQDRKHYDEHDVPSARDLAKAIFGGLGLGRESDAKRWAALGQRAWTLLLSDYEEHRATGMFLFRKLENADETYPSLVTAARRSPSPRLTTREEPSRNSAASFSPISSILRPDHRGEGSETLPRNLRYPSGAGGWNLAAVGPTSGAYRRSEGVAMRDPT